MINIKTIKEWLRKDNSLLKKNGTVKRITDLRNPAYKFYFLKPHDSKQTKSLYIFDLFNVFDLLSLIPENKIPKIIRRAGVGLICPWYDSVWNNVWTFVHLIHLTQRPTAYPTS